MAITSDSPSVMIPSEVASLSQHPISVNCGRHRERYGLEHVDDRLLHHLDASAKVESAVNGSTPVLHRTPADASLHLSTEVSGCYVNARHVRGLQCQRRSTPPSTVVTWPSPRSGTSPGRTLTALVWNEPISPSTRPPSLRRAPRTCPYVRMAPSSPWLTKIHPVLADKPPQWISTTGPWVLDSILVPSSPRVQLLEDGFVKYANASERRPAGETR